MITKQERATRRTQQIAAENQRKQELANAVFNAVENGLDWATVAAEEIAVHVPCYRAGTYAGHTRIVGNGAHYCADCGVRYSAGGNVGEYVR